MKKVLTFLLDFARAKMRERATAYHDDSLRANQPNEATQTFSYWRALVS